MYDMLIQGIGLIAFALFLLSYHVRSNRGLFTMQTAGNFLFALQFFLLGGVGGAVGSLISCFRNSLLLGSKKYPILGAKFWPVLICALSLTSCICSWQNWFSILPFFAVLSATIGYWSDNALKIRMFNLCCASPCWLICNASIHSVGGILNEAFAISSILLSIYRFGFHAMAENQFNNKKKGQKCT